MALSAMAQPQMTEDQIHCANVARLLSERFPGSDPNVLPPLPPRGTEEPPSSFVEAQELRGGSGGRTFGSDAGSISLSRRAHVAQCFWLSVI